MFTFKKFEDGVYYRDAVLASDERVKINLAEVPLANGILRIDRLSGSAGAEVRVGHYALPEIKGPIKKRKLKVKGREVHIIDNGVYQLAMVSLSGWDKMETLDTHKLNPVNDRSAVINLSNRFSTGNNTGRMLATLMLWKKSGESWSKNELVPVKKLVHSDKDNKVSVSFVKGASKTIKYELPQ